jgi:hypothetical protein
MPTRAILLLAALCSLLPACTLHRASVDMRAVEDDLRAAPAADAAAAPPGPVYLTGAPRRIVLARLEPEAREHRSAYDEPPAGPVRAVSEAATPRQADDLATRVHGVEVITLAESIGPGSVRTPADLLAAGRAHGADWFVPFTVRGTSEPNLNVLTLITLPAHLVTAGLLPTESVSADSTVTALIVDCRTGRVLDRLEHKDDAWQLACMQTSGAAGRQAAGRAENRAVRALLDDLDHRVGALLGPTPAPRATAASRWADAD